MEVGGDNGQGQPVTDGMGLPQVTDGSGHRHAITLATEPSGASQHGSRWQRGYRDTAFT